MTSWERFGGHRPASGGLGGQSLNLVRPAVRPHMLERKGAAAAAAAASVPDSAEDDSDKVGLCVFQFLLELLQVWCGTSGMWLVVAVRHTANPHTAFHHSQDEFRWHRHRPRSPTSAMEGNYPSFRTWARAARANLAFGDIGTGKGSSNNHARRVWMEARSNSHDGCTPTTPETIPRRRKLHCSNSNPPS